MQVAMKIMGAIDLHLQFFEFLVNHFAYMSYKDKPLEGNLSVKIPLD